MQSHQIEAAAKCAGLMVTVAGCIEWATGLLWASDMHEITKTTRLLLMLANMPWPTCISTLKRQPALQTCTLPLHQQHRLQSIAISRVAMFVAATAKL